MNPTRPQKLSSRSRRPNAGEAPQNTRQKHREWLAQPEPPARGETRRDKMLLDLVPVGVLIYRLDRLLYANSAFLARIGYDSLHALEEAGGLDALYVEPGVSTASSTSDTGTPVTISASQAFAGTDAVAGDRCAPLHDCVGRGFRAGADLLGRRGRRCRDRRRHRAGGPGQRALGRRSRQCRGARRHSRHHRRRHRDVRRRRQHQFVQSQRRSAVRL